jgi:hypothetical protein
MPRLQKEEYDPVQLVILQTAKIVTRSFVVVTGVTTAKAGVVKFCKISKTYALREATQTVVSNNLLDCASTGLLSNFY